MVRTVTNWPVMIASTLILCLGACSSDSAPGSASADPQATGSPGEASLATAELPEGATESLELAGEVELTEAEAAAVGIETVIAEHRSLALHLSAMGRVLAHQYRQAIVSHPFPARIAENLVRAGDWVNNPESKLKPGMFADLTIELSQNGADVVVPAEAVLDDGGGAPRLYPD